MPAADGGRHEVFKMKRLVYEVREILSKQIAVLVPDDVESAHDLLEDAYKEHVLELNADNSLCDLVTVDMSSDYSGELADLQHILHPDIHLFLKELATDIFCECHKAAKSVDYGTYNMFSTKMTGYGIKVTSRTDFESISISCGSPSRFIYLYRGENKRVNSFPSAEEIELLLTQVVSLKDLDIEGVCEPYVTNSSVLQLKEDAADFILSLRTDVMGVYKGSGYGGM